MKLSENHHKRKNEFPIFTLCDSVPMEDTFEHKMAWSTIRYLTSILAETQARTDIEWYLKLADKAPANDEMKAQVISELQSILKLG